jgi:hypothetical protein
LKAQKPGLKPNKLWGVRDEWICAANEGLLAKLIWSFEAIMNEVMSREATEIHKTGEYALKSRREDVQAAIRLEYFTVGYNALEGVAALLLGGIANSIALIGFGFDSFIETFSGYVVLRRFQTEAAGRCAAEAEHRALKYVGWSFLLLAIYITAESASKLWTGDKTGFESNRNPARWPLADCDATARDREEADGATTFKSGVGQRFKADGCVYSLVRISSCWLVSEQRVGLVVGGPPRWFGNGTVAY